MSEEKETKVLDELKILAKELRFGELVVSFKIHEGRITAGEEIDRKRKLG